MIKSRRMKWAGYVACRGEEKCVYGLGERSEDKRPLGRPERRWKDNEVAPTRTYCRLSAEVPSMTTPWPLAGTGSSFT